PVCGGPGAGRRAMERGGAGDPGGGVRAAGPASRRGGRGAGDGGWGDCRLVAAALDGQERHEHVNQRSDSARVKRINDTNAGLFEVRANVSYRPTTQSVGTPRVESFHVI